MKEITARRFRGPDRQPLRLNGHWEEKEMDEWGSEIPSNALDLLHKDLLAIHREHKASPKRSAPPAEQPAVS